MRRLSRIATICCLLVVPALPPAAAGDSGNVLVTLRVVPPDAPPHGMTVVVPLTGAPVEILNGSRVPIPVTRFSADTPSGGVSVPLTSYTYQNVGLSAIFHAAPGEDDRIELEVEIEESEADGTTSTGQPLIAVMRQSLVATLSPGEPLEVLQLRHGARAPISFELTATPLD